MMGKQAFVDLLIVLVIPALVVGAYFVWFRGPTNTIDLLSPTAWQDKGQVAANQPGAKTELILKTLRTIHLDDSLFKDPAYLSLKTYTINIPSVPISRPFPFTPPPVILEQLKAAHSSTKRTTIVSDTASTKINALDISNKINLLKGK